MGKHEGKNLLYELFYMFIFFNYLKLIYCFSPYRHVIMQIFITLCNSLKFSVLKKVLKDKKNLFFLNILVAPAFNARRNFSGHISILFLEYNLTKHMEI